MIVTANKRQENIQKVGMPQWSEADETLAKALEEKTLTPVNMPSVIDAGKIDSKAAFSYKARFEVTPDVAEVKYEGFELVKQSAEVKGEAVDEDPRCVRIPGCQAGDEHIVRSVVHGHRYE